ATSAPVNFHPRHTIRLSPGARLVLFQTDIGEGNYLHAPVSEIYVPESATLTHIRLQNEPAAAFHLSTLLVDVDEGGTYDSFTLNLGSRVARTEVHARLSGPRATTHLNAAQLLSGSQHADFTTVVRHDAPHGTSR